MRVAIRKTFNAENFPNYSMCMYYTYTCYIAMLFLLGADDTNSKEHVEEDTVEMVPSGKLSIYTEA